MVGQTIRGCRQRTHWTSTLFLVVVCTLGLLSAGCGLTRAQQEGIAAFGTAAGSLGEMTAQQFPALRNDLAAMNKLAWVLDEKDGQRNKLIETKPDGTPADRQFFVEQLQFDDGLKPRNVQVRIQAANILADYGNLLVTFTTDAATQTDLKNASDKLVASIKAYPTSLVNRPQVDELGTIVQVVGGWWIDRKKRRALEQIVPLVSPLMAQICGDLENDFDEQKEGIARLVNNSQDRLELKSSKWLRREPTGSLGDRLLEVDAFNLAVETKAKLDAVSEKTLAAVSALRRADTRLVDLVRDGRISTSDIRDFYQQAKELADAVRGFIH